MGSSDNGGESGAPSRRVSEFIEAGGVAAAIQTLRGNIYTGICIDSACSLGMCAERNAAAHMLTCGESAIAKIVCINWNRDFLPPCGAYREFLKELAPENGKLLDSPFRESHRHTSRTAAGVVGNFRRKRKPSLGRLNS